MGRQGREGFPSLMFSQISFQGMDRQEVGGIIVTCHICRGTGHTSDPLIEKAILQRFFLILFHHKFTHLNIRKAHIHFRFILEVFFDLFEK